MDQNKLAALKQIGYSILGNCGLCAHSTFASSTSMYGYCSAITYEHLKHLPATRSLSVHREGRCDRLFSLDTARLEPLREWKVFVKSKP